jgi:hypothetical protein
MAAAPRLAFAVDGGTVLIRPPPNGLEDDCKDLLSPNRASGHPESAQGRVGAFVSVRTADPGRLQHGFGDMGAAWQTLGFVTK